MLADLSEFCLHFLQKKIQTNSKIRYLHRIELFCAKLAAINNIKDIIDKYNFHKDVCKRLFDAIMLPDL